MFCTGTSPPQPRTHLGITLETPVQEAVADTGELLLQQAPCNLLSTEAGGSSSWFEILYIHLRNQAQAVKGHGQGTQQILFAVPRCTLVCSSFSHTCHFLLQREVESGNDPDRFYTKEKRHFLYRLLHRDEGKYVTKVSILPASLCFFF